MHIPNISMIEASCFSDDKKCEHEFQKLYTKYYYDQKIFPSNTWKYNFRLFFENKLPYIPRNILHQKILKAQNLFRFEQKFEDNISFMQVFDRKNAPARKLLKPTDLKFNELYNFIVNAMELYQL